MLKRTMIVGTTCALVTAACGGAPLPAPELASSQSAMAAAKEAGADDVPIAAKHLKLAQESITAAEKQIQDEEYADAKRLLVRAEADAELARDLARAQTAREDARIAQQKIQELQAEIRAQAPTTVGEEEGP